ncbi:hypothetical protein VCSRO153_2310 [Vibrio cholerae]|uniref:hypothetical protein n=1 Tax=Vibrio TaxID=662 RepID=UPI0001B99265|nr:MULTISPECIES: hypothetical protein [Vibrio]EEX67079.1 hypothetical protein VCJ_000706 [Vibrio metoecus]TXX35940.1 hypothetical protein FXF13_09325 [Vibrio cholerae]BCN18199.1 putative O-antigen polymerase [Vibrio cholerae]GHW69358.1 hypothetical protein VCSRO153_2310 [Vibrio cholerae]
MSNINTKSLFYIGVFLLLLSPLSQSFEIVKLYTGGIDKHDDILTPTYFKIIKDLSLLTFLGYFLIKVFKDKVSVLKFFVIVTTLLYILVVMFISTSKGNDFLFSILGLHWFLPVFLLYFSLGSVDKEEWRLLMKATSILFLVHFSLQLSQLFFSTGYYGEIAGLSARNPGMYIIPNTASLFSLLYLILCLRNRQTSLAILAVISTILTGSGTGIVVMLVVFVHRIFYPYRIYVYLTSPLLALIAYMALVFILRFRGGAEYVGISLGTRLKYIYDALFIWSINFGEGTNIALSLGLTEKLMDSTYASILVNTGYIGFLIYVVLLLCSFAFFEVKGNKECSSFILMIILISFTNIIMSISMFNILLPLAMSYLLLGQKEDIK